MTKPFRRMMILAAAVCVAALLAGCTSQAAVPSASPTPSPTPTPEASPISGLPAESGIDRDGFNITCGTLVTDGTKAYYRCEGGSSELWEIREIDLATKKVRTLIPGSSYPEGCWGGNLFLDGGILYYTVISAGGDMVTLYRYDETESGAASTKLTDAQTLLVSRGKIYLVLNGVLFEEDISGSGRSTLMDPAPMDFAISPQKKALLEDEKTATLIRADGAKEKLALRLPEHANKDYFWDRTYADFFGQARIYGDMLFYFALYASEGRDGEVQQLVALDTVSKTVNPVFTLQEGFELIDFTLYDGKVYYLCDEFPQEIAQKVTYHLYEYDLNTQDNREITRQEYDYEAKGFMDAYMPITLYEHTVLCWFLESSKETSEGITETYALTMTSLEDGTSQTLDTFQYVSAWDGE